MAIFHVIRCPCDMIIDAISRYIPINTWATLIYQPYVGVDVSRDTSCIRPPSCAGRYRCACIWW